MDLSQLPHLTDRELEIMQLLWEHEKLSAGEIAGYFLKTQNQFRNTTYTFISRLLEKGVIRRDDPGFICVPLYERDVLLLNEAKSFIDKIYDGSFQDMFAQFVRQQALSPQDISELQKLIDESKKVSKEDDQYVK